MEVDEDRPAEDRGAVRVSPAEPDRAARRELLEHVEVAIRVSQGDGCHGAVGASGGGFELDLNVLGPVVCQSHVSRRPSQPPDLQRRTLGGGGHRQVDRHPVGVEAGLRGSVGGLQSGGEIAGGRVYEQVLVV